MKLVVWTCGLQLLLLLTVSATITPQWSEWSDWSPCSRSCDGGVSFRRRRCMGGSNGNINDGSNNNSVSVPACVGPEREDRLCHMQECPEMAATEDEEGKGKKDFRTQQCELFNDVPYEGRYYEWEAAPEDLVSSEDVCSLLCRPLNSDASASISSAIKMDRAAVDGTRCRKDRLDVCISGQCRLVGCDLQLDSSKRVDTCGVCGGDGSSCPLSSSSFKWMETALSECSAPCGGGGYMMARPICVDEKGQRAADEDLCRQDMKPPARMAPCNSRPCPPRWEVQDWGPCTRSCGGGIKSRLVACVIDKDGKRLKVPKNRCPNSIPALREVCNPEECPQWYTGIWSQCSLKCGSNGLQHRNVICRDGKGQPSGACDLKERPTSSQSCAKTPDCSEEDNNNNSNNNNNEDLDESERWRKGAAEDSVGWKKLEGVAEETVVVGVGAREEEEEEELIPPVQQKLTDVKQQVAGADASFITEEWSPCSARCGEGIRTRKVDCKIFLEFSKTVATLPDAKCPGPKPEETEICFAGLCDPSKEQEVEDVEEEEEEVRVPPPKTELLQQSMQSDFSLSSPLRGGNFGKKSFEWKEDGFTACSESCLGGLQESKIACIDTNTQSPVSPVNCANSERPETKVQTCNDHPCPPRWNVSDFGHCSKSCGGGTQNRLVSCIQEVRHGNDNILRVDDRFCPQPPPITQQFCNVVDCPVRWFTTAWTKCTKECGTGMKYRKVRCQQLLALGELAEKPDSNCPGNRPSGEAECNQHVCNSYDYERADTSAGVPGVVGSEGASIKADRGQKYLQDPKEDAVKIKVGGRATIFEGTKLKIRCPVKESERSLLRWAQGSAMVRKGGGGGRRGGKKKGNNNNSNNHNNNHSKMRSKAFVTKKGALVIKSVALEDAGVYTCLAQHSSESIEIIVKSRSVENDVILGNDLNDPLRTIIKYNSRFQEKNKKKQEEEEEDELGGIYGVVKHMTDEPYSIDEYSYGKLPSTTVAMTTSTTTTVSPIEDDNWKIFSRKSGSGNDRWDPHRLFVTPSSTPRHQTQQQQGDVEGYMRFNTVHTDWQINNNNNNNNKLGGGRLTHHHNNKGGEEDNEVGNTFWSKDRVEEEDMEEDYPNTDSRENSRPTNSATSSSSSSSSSGSGGGGGGGGNGGGALLSHVLFLVCLVAATQIINQKRHLDYPDNDGTSRGSSNSSSSSSSNNNNKPSDQTETPMRLEWRTSTWSRCSQTCGTEGRQTREVECLVLKGSSPSESIPLSLCIDSGLSPLPESVKACNQAECPQWLTGRWKSCADSPCFARNSALQTRSVTCGTKGSKANLTLEEKFCEAVLKPKQSRPCSNFDCKGKWETGEWTECSTSCGAGIRTRRIHCVWQQQQQQQQQQQHNNNSRANETYAVEEACKEIIKPNESQECEKQPCGIPPKTEAAVTTCSSDQSKYCGLVKSFKMCHIPKYQQQCCQSCAS